MKGLLPKKIRERLSTFAALILILALLIGIIFLSFLPLRTLRFTLQGVFSLFIIAICFHQVLTSYRYRIQSEGFIKEVADLNKRFGILADAVTAVSSSVDLQEMASNILSVMLTLTGASIGVILLPDEKKKFFEVIAQRGFKEQAIEGLRVPLHKGNIGKAYSSGQMLIRDALPEDPKAAEKYLDGVSPSTQVIMPLKAKGQTVGVAITATLQPHQYTQEEINLLGNLCHELAVAMITAELYRQSQRTLEWLADAQEYTEHFIEEMDAGVLVINEDGHIIYFNSKAREITGIEPKEIIGTNHEYLGDPYGKFSILHPFHSMLASCLNEDKAFRRQELIITRKEGGKVALGFNIFPLHRARGGLMGAALIFNDITAVKEMEARLRQQDHLSILGQMAAKIAHEVKNPIFAILGLAEELKESETDGERAHLVDMIIQEASLCNQWIGGMLTFSKAPSLIADVQQSQLNLAECVHQLLVDFTRANGKENFKIVEDYEENLPLVRANFDQLRHIFNNLFENAFHAMPQGGVLTVRARNVGNGHVEVRVEDTGTGIKTENLPSIFAPFFTTKEEGTGLGLAIVQKIVMDIGGSIDVVSQENVGTAFILKLPAA
jgi:PAS domain S-box-containing protein